MKTITEIEEEGKLDNHPSEDEYYEEEEFEEELDTPSAEREM